LRDLLITPGFQVFKEKIISGRITDSMAEKTHSSTVSQNLSIS